MYIGSIQPIRTAPTVASSTSAALPPIKLTSQNARNPPPTAARNCVPSRRSGLEVYIPAEISRER